ncbi:MAG: AMP-binding protein, partial [Planctomycetales bacterium]
MSEPIWTPTDQQVASANMTRFLRFVEEREATSLDGYHALWQWSVQHSERFWPALWQFCGVLSSQPWSEVLLDGEQMPGAQWFADARLNFAENLLRHNGEQSAIIAWNEQGLQQRLSFTKLREEVARIAAWMRSIGIKKGDRVAALTPNLPETVITMLATASIGAIFSSCSPDFGTEAIIERFGQIEPTVLLVAAEYQYGGKAFESLERARQLTSQVPSIRHTIVVPYMQQDPPLHGLAGPILWDTIESCETAIVFEQLPFDHPLYILYSSGTTGKPKCIVHGAGGTLLQHLKELVLHT